MPTLDELMQKFASAAEEETTASEAPPAAQPFNAGGAGETKLASGGSMKSLTDIYLSLTDADDMAKEAAQVAQVPYETDGEEVDFAKLAEDIANREAGEIVAEEDDIIKVAAEYDAAGRIMARGFYDEFMKLAEGLDVSVTPNQNTENPSTASTPSLGERGMVTVPTNYAGSDKHDQPIPTTGPGLKQVYADVLKTKKTISAGQGTGDDPEAAAISLGGGSPVGFATVRDLAGGKPA